MHTEAKIQGGIPAKNYEILCLKNINQNGQETPAEFSLLKNYSILTISKIMKATKKIPIEVIVPI